MPSLVDTVLYSENEKPFWSGASCFLIIRLQDVSVLERTRSTSLCFQQPTDFFSLPGHYCIEWQKLNSTKSYCRADDWKCFRMFSLIIMVLLCLRVSATQDLVSTSKRHRIGKSNPNSIRSDLGSERIRTFLSVWKCDPIRSRFSQITVFQVKSAQRSPVES